jgi:hypothetical protein
MSWKKTFRKPKTKMERFRTGFCLLLTVRGWRGLSGDKDIGGELMKRPGSEAACQTIEEV